MKHSNKFLITGGSFINKGAEAMALTVRDSLMSAFPESKIFMRVAPQYFDIARANGFIPVNSKPPVSLSEKMKSKVIAFGHYLMDDALIDIGGYQLGDPWGWQQAKGIAKKIRYCNIFGTKTIFMPQALGPFTHKAFERYIPFIINECCVFYIRDKKSLEDVNNICPVNEERLQPDLAWNFNAEGEEIDTILDKYKITLTRPAMCVTPNLRVYERHGEHYLDYLSIIIGHLVKQNYQVILLGHELRLDSKKDDRFLCRLLNDQNEAAIHIDEFLSAKQIKRIVGLCEFVISSRFHALIAALSQQIPAVAIGWSHKYSELLSDVGLPNNVLEITDAPHDVNAINSKLVEIVQQLDNQRKTLSEKIPSITKKSGQMLDRVVAAIGE